MKNLLNLWSIALYLSGGRALRSRRRGVVFRGDEDFFSAEIASFSPSETRSLEIVHDLRVIFASISTTIIA